MNFGFISKILENKKNRNKLLIYIALFIVGFFIVFSDYGLLKRYSLIQKKRELISNIENEKKVADSLKKEINLLKYDTLSIERIAREKYGLIKPDETVIMVNPEDE